MDCTERVLPPGLTLYTDGELSGRPTSAGTYNFTLQVTDGYGGAAQRAFALVVQPSVGSLTLDTPSPLPQGLYGQPYSANFSSTGVEPFTYSLDSGALPAGFTISPSGVLSSNGPTIAGGFFYFTVRVQDSSPGSQGGPLSATRSYSLYIASNNPSPTLTSLSRTSIPAGSLGFPLTLTGSNFLSGAKVFWNGTALTTTFVNAGELTAAVPTALLAAGGTVYIYVQNPDGLYTNTLYFNVILPAPVLSSLSPASVYSGGLAFTLQVVGRNFLAPILPSEGPPYPGSVIYFNGQPLTTVYDSPMQLHATVPATLVSTPGTVPVTVQNYDEQISNTLQFTIAGAPTLTKLTPDTTAAGSAQFTLVLEGTNFNPNVRVEWNGDPLTTYVDSSTSLRAIVDAGRVFNSGVYPVLVRAPEGLTSNTLNFTVTGNNPAITSLSPDTFAAGSPLSQLTVNGTGFQSDAVVYWNTTALVTAFVSDTKLMAVAPANLLATPGVAQIQVRNIRAQTVSATRDLPVTGTGPAITSLAPNQAQTGSPQLTLTVNGINFLSGATVRLNNVDLATTFVSATQLTAIVPATLLAASGDFPVIVRNPDSQLSPPATFTVSPNAVPPQITTLTPSTVTPGGPAFTLAVQGSGFQSGAVVRWNGQDLTTIFVSATALTAGVPQTLIAAAGTAMILVHNPNGLNSNQVSFPITTTPPPAISVLNPNSAAAGSPQFTLSVQGTGFQSGAIVRWNNQDLVTSFVSTTLLNATVSASLLVSPGTAQVVVRNADQQTSTPATFTIPTSLPPTITSLNPPAVNALAGPVTLVVNGTNFQNGATVLWNGGALVTAFVNNTQVTALVPAALSAFPGTATVQVRNPDNQTSTGVAILIRFLPPQIISMSPLAVIAGASELALSVNALNVQNGAIVLWNGQPLQTTASVSAISATPSTLTANVLPISLFAVPGNVSIAVRNPDGQTSLPFTFQVIAPPPVITSLDPATVYAGSPTLQLRVRGTGFRNLSLARWNGQPLPTAFIDATQLTATIDSGLILSPGSAGITVYNTDGAVSNSFALPISQSLTPEITALTPASAPVGGPAFTLGVAGKNFVPASQILWNGAPLATTFGSAAQLSGAVSSTLLATPGAVTVTVRQPDGKTSAGAVFAIGEALKITSNTPLPAAIKDSTYQFAFTASGGARPYQWRLASGSNKLPDGLTLAADGTLSGKPSAAAPFPFTVEVVDATNTAVRQDATLVVDSRDLGITSTSPLPPATAGAPYSFIMKSNARAALQLAWSVVEGALPAGLALNADTGEISGVPEEPADPGTATAAAKSSRSASVPVDFTFRIQVAATDRNPFRKQFALTVLPAQGGFRIITPSPLPDATKDHPVHLQIAAAGGKAPYSFALQGTLPAGVTFSPTGVLDGTPTALGSSGFTVTATDGAQQQASQAYQWRVIDGANGPIISSGPLLPVSASGRPIDVLVEAVQGTRPFAWSIISGTLPGGITFDPPTGRLSGATAQEGLFRFTVKVTDANGRIDQRVLGLPVTATGEPLTMVTAALPPATLGVAYSLALQASGGKAPYEWSLASGSLPAGLRLAGDQITGAPTDPAPAAITLRLRDAFGFVVNRDFNLAVNIAALPSARITGLPDSINPGQQPSLGLQLDTPYPVEVTGRLGLTFAAIPDAPGVEPGLMFSTGGRTVSFRIPAGQTAAIFPRMPLAFQAGSVSGTLTLHPTFLVAGTEVIPSNSPDRGVRIEPAPPVISTVNLERRSGGFNIVVTGFSSTRELSEMVVTLTPATGRELLQTRYVVALTDVFKKWYASQDSFAFGGQFQLTVPFDGDATAVQSAAIRLRNSAGESEERRTN
ncbi:MAG: putative Ig domain-containing protein [Bryobacterales bacterium]|nr:putative Ig domain-containing protein [Bryobacterales bacterium]